MSTIIHGDFDVGKCDKKYFHIGSNGRRYMDFKIMPSPNSKFGTEFMVLQRVSKEARLAGVRDIIIGNAKTMFSKDEPTPFDEEEPEAKLVKKSKIPD